jgi:hypothetical protein
LPSPPSPPAPGFGVSCQIRARLLGPWQLLGMRQREPHPPAAVRRPGGVGRGAAHLHRFRPDRTWFDPRRSLDRRRNSIRNCPTGSHRHHRNYVRSGPGWDGRPRLTASVGGPPTRPRASPGRGAGRQSSFLICLCRMVAVRPSWGAVARASSIRTAEWEVAAWRWSATRARGLVGSRC